MQRFANLVDLVKRFPSNIYLQKSASIQLKTSPDKFAVQVGLVWARWARFHPYVRYRFARQLRSWRQVAHGVPSLQANVEPLYWNDYNVTECFRHYHRTCADI